MRFLNGAWSVRSTSMKKHLSAPVVSTGEGLRKVRLCHFCLLRRHWWQTWRWKVFWPRMPNRVVLSWVRLEEVCTKNCRLQWNMCAWCTAFHIEPMKAGEQAGEDTKHGLYAVFGASPYDTRQVGKLSISEHELLGLQSSRYFVKMILSLMDWCAHLPMFCCA